MTREKSAQPLTLDIPSDLNAAAAVDIHASLVTGLDMVEAGDATIAVTLGEERRDCAPLALQLLISAERSFPAGTLTIDERGRLALAPLPNSKDS